MEAKRILRVFPRLVKAATPDDDLAVVGREPELADYGRCDEVHVSVTFDWDKPKGERLAEAWQVLGVPVKLGGPAYLSEAGEFTPGMYLKKGYTITSRGCPNKCDFCKVPEREGALRMLPIRDGWNVLDNNLLACPMDHQRAVFDMLDRQCRPVRFTGGIEAARFTNWHLNRMCGMKIESMWMAYDYPADYEPLMDAVAMMQGTLVRPHKSKVVGAYVLMGRRGDTPEAAEKRLRSVIALGIKTQAMLFDNGAQCKPEDMKHWWALRKKFTDAREVGKMVAETWDNNRI